MREVNFWITITGSTNLKKRFTRESDNVYTHPRVALRVRGTGFCFWRAVARIYLTSSTFKRDRREWTNGRSGDAHERTTSNGTYISGWCHWCVLDAIWEQSTERHAANQTRPWYIPEPSLAPSSIRSCPWWEFILLSLSLPLFSNYHPSRFELTLLLTVERFELLRDSCYRRCIN